MKMLKIAAALAIVCVPAASITTSANAATAHNSQLGSRGNTTNSAAPVKKGRMMKRHMKKRMM